MDIKQFERDFLAANAKTATSVMNAIGWKAGIVNADNVNTDSVFLYAFDHQSKWTWCCSVPRASFFLLVAASSAAPSAERAVLPALCSQAIAKAASSATLEPGLENELAVALSAYFGMTQSYQLTEGATKANHFFVIRYGATEHVRPYASPGPARYLIAADEVQASIGQVLAMDAQRHPEWLSAKANGAQGSPGKPWRAGR